VSDLEVREERYDGPAATALIAEVQAEYVVRYGGPDEAKVDPDEFAPPRGMFLVGYLDDQPVVTGGWRLLDESPTGELVAELKRMFVVGAHRRRGLSRVMLRALEDSARAAGVTRMILITGIKQPEAIELYRTSGYEVIPGFGYYAGYPDARFYGKAL
jgi:GNAT superfamily N-acetyltransferase